MSEGEDTPSPQQTDYSQEDVWIHMDNPFETGVKFGLGFFAAFTIYMIALMLMASGMLGGAIAGL